MLYFRYKVRKCKRIKGEIVGEKIAIGIKKKQIFFRRTTKQCFVLETEE